MEKKTKHEIAIIGREYSGNLTRGRLEDSLKIGTVTSEKLKTELANITASVGETLETINLGLKQYFLDEISIKLEITTEGKIALLGSGVSTSGTGGIELKFKKKD